MRPEYTADLRKRLDDAGVPVGDGMELSHGPVVDLLIATVETPAMWAALGGTVTAFLAINKHKVIKVSGKEITLKGYGTDDAEQIIRVLRETIADQDEQLRQLGLPTVEDPPETSTDGGS